MTKKIKLSRKKIKQPDEFLTRTDTILRWAEEHVWQLMFLVGVLLAAALIFRMGLSWSLAQKDAKGMDLAQATTIYNASVTGDEFSPFMAPGSQGYATAHEKYQAAIRAFNKIVESHSGATEADIALLYLGSSYENLKDYNSAIDFYSKFENSRLAKIEPTFNDSATIGKARCHYALGNYQPAMQLLASLINNDSPLKTEAMLLKARTLFKTGKRGLAEEILKDMREQAPEAWNTQPVDFLASYWMEREGQGEPSAVDIDLDDLGESVIEMPEFSIPPEPDADQPIDQ